MKDSRHRASKASNEGKRDEGFSACARETGERLVSVIRFQLRRTGIKTKVMIMGFGGFGGPNWRPARNERTERTTSLKSAFAFMRND